MDFNEYIGIGNYIFKVFTFLMNLIIICTVACTRVELFNRLDTRSSRAIHIVVVYANVKSSYLNIDMLIIQYYLVVRRSIINIASSNEPVK